MTSSGGGVLPGVGLRAAMSTGRTDLS